MKYIDADRLKAEIARLGRNWDGAQELQPVSLFQADLYELLAIIDSLQQEQPETDLEKASRNVYESWMGGTMDDVRRDMVELDKVLNARKEEKK